MNDTPWQILVERDHYAVLLRGWEGLDQTQVITATLDHVDHAIRVVVMTALENAS